MNSGKYLTKSSIIDRIVFVLGGTIAVLSLFVIVASYFWVDESRMQYMDFRNSFYIAGLLVQEGKIAEVYPKKSDQWFEQTEFNKFAHTKLKYIKDKEACNFLYPPLFALLFAPLSLLEPRISYLVWQLILLSALALATMVFCTVPGMKKTWQIVFAGSFLAFPLLHLLLFGQVAIIVGILPLVLGYAFWQNKRNLPAGICFALLSMKMQLFAPVLFIILAKFIAACLTPPNNAEERKSAFTEANHLIGGLLIGFTLFQVLPLIFTGPAAFFNWLHALQLVNRTIGSPSQEWAQHLVISLPAAITFLLPAAWNSYAKIISAIVCIVLSFLSIYVLTRIALSIRSSPAREKDVLIVTAFLFLPLITPYLRIYDYTVFLVPTWIAFYRIAPDDSLQRVILRTMLFAWAALDSYLVLLFIIGHASMMPLLVVLILFLTELCRRVVFAALRFQRPAAVV